MHPREKPTNSAMEEILLQKQIRKDQKNNNNNRQNTAEQNLRQLMTTNPEAAKMINIQLADSNLPDPFTNSDAHSPKRSFNKNQ